MKNTTGDDNLLKNNIDDSGNHNILHNFMKETLSHFNVIRLYNAPEMIGFHEGRILSKRSYGNFKMTRIKRRRVDEFTYLPEPKEKKNTHSMLYISRYKNYFKLQNTLIEED